MRYLSVIPVALVFLSLVTAERKSYRGYEVLSAELKNQGHLDLITRLENAYPQQLDFFTHPSLLRKTDVMVTPQVKGTIKRMLKTVGIPFTVKVSDVEKLTEDNMARSVTGNKRMATSYSELIKQDYLSYSEIEGFLQTLESTYPDVMRLETIGKTYEGKNINMVTLSKNFGEKRPAIVMEALTHAREWITGAVILNLIQALADGSNSYMMDHFDWYIVPVHNPDGYEYSRNSDRYWRKNRNRDYSRWCYGVDLNRNWDYHHREEGTSSNACDSTYGGPNGFSEMETFVFKEKILEINRATPILGFLSLHAYSQVLLTPMAFSQESPETYGRSSATLAAMANNAINALENVSGTKFIIGTPKQTLGYGASGGAYDWALAEVGIPYSYTYELRPDGGNGLGGFELPPSEIMPSFYETLASIDAIVNGIYGDKSVYPQK